MDKDLMWEEAGRESVFDARIFSLSRVQSVSPAGERGVFSVIESNDWAIVVPLVTGPRGDEFVMVKQWRHGARALCVEFPGGVIEKGEDAVAGALRELREETALVAGTMTLLATMSPNPAIMANRVHFFLAEDLHPTGAQELDKDEFVEIVRVPVEEAVQGMGKPPYLHALMATALFHCLRARGQLTK
jgi:8-oxo-dGTP pyrophosphatase MutT (NUDIX family)